MITLDMQNALNSSNWNHIRRSLAAIGLTSYLTGLCAGTAIVEYHDVLNVPVAGEATIAGYTDDIAVINAAKDLADVELYSSEAITAIKMWLKDAGLALPEDKTEAVFITKRRKEATYQKRKARHRFKANNTK